MKVGFIGIGAMGHPMALNLLQAGHQLLLWGRTPAKFEKLISAGARFASSPADLAREVELVGLCLTDTAAVEQVVFGGSGLAEGLQPGTIVVDCSSIDPAATRVFARRLRTQCGCAWLDAPVSGGVKGATAGTLTIMAGGEESAFECAAPFFDAIGSRRTLVGASGSGQIAKACNQLIIGASLNGIAEALKMAAASGLDPELIPDTLQDGWADSPLLQGHGRRMAAMLKNMPREDQGMGISRGLMVKDMQIALDQGAASAVHMPVTRLVAERYREVLAKGLPEHGQVGIVQLDWCEDQNQGGNHGPEKA